MYEIGKPDGRIGGPRVKQSPWRFVVASLLTVTISGAALTLVHKRYNEWIFGTDGNVTSKLTRPSSESTLKPITTRDPNMGQIQSGDDAHILQLIGIPTIPAAILKDQYLRGWLDQLKRETCNRAAVSPLSLSVRRQII